MYNFLKIFFKEFKNFNNFVNDSKKDNSILFFSEKNMDFRYYEDLINSIIDRSDLNIIYATSDPEDFVFSKNNVRIKPIYIKSFIAPLIARNNTRALVMTMPDLGRFNIKKSRNNVNHIYTFHSMISTHMQYHPRAYDDYDTIFCVGPYHVEEIRKREEMNNLSPKNLIEFGYPLAEKIYREHQDYLSNTAEAEENNQKTILIAPTWGPNCILATCIEKIIQELSSTSHNVFIRPHPEFTKRNPGAIKKLLKTLEAIDNISLETDLMSESNIHGADLLITDWSGIAFEYAFGTERPVLFVNAPRKVNNPNYKDLGIDPIAVKLRYKIGVSIDLGDMNKIKDRINELISNKDKFREEIISSRSKYIFNWMSSAEKGAEYITNLYV